MIPVVGEVAGVRARTAGRMGPLGLVPTMGALHEGHLSLVRAARRRCASVCVSIFVNPLQFGAGEDFDAYPRDLERDVRLLTAEGVDWVFAPDAAEFTPKNAATTVHVAGLTERLEGLSRPGHFDGVATIVAKLFNVTTPNAAFFGEKDYQQLLVIRQMVADLDMGVEIVACPVVREPDGLAMSSRNVRLSPARRTEARALSAALETARDAWDGDADATRARLRSMIDAAPGVDLDYAEVADPITLEPLHGRVAKPARALVAARVGSVRLIDNVELPDRAQPSTS